MGCSCQRVESSTSEEILESVYDEGIESDDEWGSEEFAPADDVAPRERVPYRFGFAGETPGRDEEPIGVDTRAWVSNTKEAPFRYICNLEYDFPGIGRWGMCTGTLIGPRTVLTAGHCLFDASTGKAREAGRLRVIPGRQGSLEPLAATVGRAIILAPGYRPSSPTDFGIIHLADPIGSTVGYWSAGYRKTVADPTGTSILNGSLPAPAGTLPVNVSGYPADKPGASKYGCWDPKGNHRRCKHTLLGSSARNRACGTVPYRSYDKTTLLQGGMLHYLNDTCPGHSGSPVWVRRHPSKGGRVLVGVHVAGDDPQTSGVANRAVFINAKVRAFIVAHTK